MEMNLHIQKDDKESSYLIEMNTSNDMVSSPHFT